MPEFNISYIAKETVHQRQLIVVEANTLAEAVEVIESYEFDNSNVVDLGKPLHSEWLIDDVKAYDPNNSVMGFALSDTAAFNPSTFGAATVSRHRERPPLSSPRSRV